MMHADSLELPILTVSEFNQSARFCIESQFECVWIEGEISNFIAHSSGHWYFSLKDETCQIRAAFFRTKQRGILFTPKNGMHVLVKARASIYEQRGDFQLIVDDMEERGEGKLRRLFEELKKTLSARGWFSAEHKKPLPTYPECIGIVSSPTGAAVHDVLTVLKRRYPAARVIIYPCLVQGKEAAGNIEKTIQLANKRNECDALIVARGGGSLEDLWAFNEERVARAIFESTLPIVTGIGHEIDFTIADFVADLRAATPSAAAECLTPDTMHVRSTLQQHSNTLIQKIQHRLHYHQQSLLLIEKHLLTLHPQHQLSHAKHQLLAQLQQLKQLMMSQIHKKREKIAVFSEKIDALSPLKTLARGYCLAYDSSGQLIKHTHQVNANDVIHVRVQDGEMVCQVKQCITS